MFRYVLILILVASALLAQDREKRSVTRTYHLGGLPPAAGTQLRHPEECELSMLGLVSRNYEPRNVEEKPEISSKQVVSTVSELFGEINIDMGISETPTRNLLVTTSEDVHRQLDRALQMLIRNSSASIEVEVRHLSLPLRKVDDSIRSLLATATGSLSREGRRRLEALDRNKGDRGGTLHIPPGRWGTYRATRSLRYLPNFEVEIAQGSAIADPVPMRATEGIVASVRPFVLQDGRVMLRVVAAAGDLGAKFRRFRIKTTDMAWINRATNLTGELEQGDFRGCIASTEALIEVGGSVAISMSRPGEDGAMEVLLLTVKAAPAPPEAGGLTILPLGALTAPDDAYRLAWSEDEEEHGIELQKSAPTIRVSADLVEALLQEVMVLRDAKGFLYGTPWLHGGALFARMDAAPAKALKERVASLERELLRSVRLKIELLAGDETVGLLSAPLLVDRAAAFAAYHQLDFLGDYEVEVAQEARIADPVRDFAYGGMFANVKVSPTGSRNYRLRLDLRIAVMGAIRTINPAAGGFGALQSVPVRTRHVRTALDLAPGRPKTIDLGRNPYAPDVPGRLIARVSVD